MTAFSPKVTPRSFRSNRKVRSTGRGSVPRTPVRWSVDGMMQRTQGLTRVRVTGPIASDAMLREGGEPIEHEARAEAVHGQSLGKPPVQILERGAAAYQNGVAIREC